MLIDDDENMNVVMKLALETVGGWQLEICLSGKEAIEKVSSFQPDLILLDAVMPDMSGPETLQALRKIPTLSQIPVLFISGKNRDELLEEVKFLGACGVLRKPFNPLTLKDSIQKIWDESQAIHP